MGHKFSFTNSGKEAVDLIKNNSYDLVLLNLAMPNFSGYNVIEELEKKDNINNFNIVLLSEYTINDAEIRRLVQKGIRGIIKKPIELHDLQKEIEELIKS